MGLLYIQEHLDCLSYDHSQRPQIEILTFSIGQQAEVFIGTNEIVFFVKGSIRQVFRDYPEYENSAGEFIFLPCGGKISLLALSESIVTVFRMEKPLKLCEHYLLEQLYPLPVHTAQPSVASLRMNKRVRHFLQGVNSCVSDGLGCRHFYDLKVRELFLMLRAYYTKEQLRVFLGLILTMDTLFSECVRKNWDKYPTVRQMAAFMGLSQKHFSSKFKCIFGQTAYKWIKQSKAWSIHQEIVSTGKSLKHIAEENGF